MATPLGQVAEKSTMKPKQPFSQREASHSESEDEVVQTTSVWSSLPTSGVNLKPTMI